MSTGTFETRDTFDENGRVTRFACFAPGPRKVNCGTSGYHAMLFERDASNRTGKASFEDTTGKPTLNITAAFQRFQYDSYDRNVEVTGYDRAGDPTNTLGAATQRYLFDQRGRRFAILMLEKHGTPAAYRGCLFGLSCPAGRSWHAMRVEWSPRGHVLYNVFFDRHLQLIERVDCARKQCFD